MFPKIGGKPPKWMVYNGSNPIKMDDLGVKHTTIFGSTPIYIYNMLLRLKTCAFSLFFTSTFGDPPLWVDRHLYEEGHQIEPRWGPPQGLVLDDFNQYCDGSETLRQLIRRISHYL